MSKSSDAEKFEKRWNSHIDELEKLGMTMSVEQFEEGDYEEVKEHIEELKELVSKTAEELTE